jgi:hypothetical protein
MNIIITHCRYAPKWDTLQRIIREATNELNGELTRISRTDGGCDYRALGEYDLDFKRTNHTILPVKLTVIGVGKQR